MQTQTWIRWLAAPAALLLVGGAWGCRSDEPAAPGGGTAAAVGETVELPAGPPPGAEESPVEIDPDVDAGSGLEVRFGLRLGGGGVEEPVLSFGRGDRVCLGVTLPGAAGQELEVHWFDAAGVERGAERLLLAGEPARGGLCLSGSDDLGLGSYAVEFERSGEAVGDAVFAVSDARESARRGGA